MNSFRLARKKSRNAMSAVLGGVVILAIIFSVVTAYFAFDLGISTTLGAYSNQRAQTDLVANSESFDLAGVMLPNGTLGVNVTNVGPTTIQVVSVFVGNASTNIVLGADSLVSSNVELNPGVARVLSGNYAYTSGQVWIKVTTALGTSRVAIYPAPNSNSSGGILSALVAGSIGDIYIDFMSYTYYQVVSCAPISSSYSGYCLKLPGNQAFTIPSANAANIAFSVRVVNYNVYHMTITLDNFTNLFQFWPAGSSFRAASWYIISNDTSGDIANSYTPIALPYNVTMVIVFADAAKCSANNCIPDKPFQPTNTGTGSEQIPSPGLASTFMFAHGWKNVPVTALPNYGQNIPYVTTKYY